MPKKKSWSRGFYYTSPSGRRIRTKTPTFDSARQAAEWVEKGSGFYSTSGKWIQTAPPPTPKEIEKAVKNTVKLANAKIEMLKKADLTDFSSELKQHSVFLNDSGFFTTDIADKTEEELTAMLQQAASFNEDTEDLSDYIDSLEEARQFYENLLGESEADEYREEKVKELRKLVDTAAQEIFDLTRDSDFLDKLYNIIDNDLDRMVYIKQYAGEWSQNSDHPVFSKWAEYDYSDFVGFV